MIDARKSVWVDALLARHAERRIRRTFGRSWVQGLPHVRAAIDAGPVLVVSNHTSWWDPLVLLWACRRLLDAHAYAMMDAKNLARAPFFRGVGAFGVDLSDPADGARGIRYAAKLLDRPRRLLWVFPQGREVPITARELDFRAGAAQIARIARRATVIPAAIRYEYGDGPLPELWLAFGEPLAPGRDVAALHANQEQGVRRALNAIDAAILHGVRDKFERRHERRPGALFAIAQAILARVTRVRELSR